MSFKVTAAEFLKSASAPEDFPPAGAAEVAFAGRSNVGKSSVINILTARKRLAITSSTPGRTRLVNFFDIEGRMGGAQKSRQIRLVDLPGYGYAKAAHDEREEWRGRVEGYLVGREKLSAVVHLLDLRHSPTDLDLDLGEWLGSLGLNRIAVFTKADKLTRNQQSGATQKLEQELGLSKGSAILFSSLDGTGRDDLWKRIFSLVGAPR